MASFKDNQGREWAVKLDGPTIEEIEEKHSINLANLESDPMLRLRHDPMTLVAVIYLICQEQIEKMQLTPKQFAKCLPTPPDPMIDAVAEAIVNFFPSGRASHVREVLTKFDRMSQQSDSLQAEKMEMVLTDPKTKKRLSLRADLEIQKSLDELYPMSSEPGSSLTVEST